MAAAGREVVVVVATGREVVVATAVVVGREVVMEEAAPVEPPEPPLPPERLEEPGEEVPLRHPVGRVHAAARPTDAAVPDTATGLWAARVAPGERPRDPGGG